MIVSNENAGTVTVIDARTHAIVATIPVGKRPRGMQVSPDGKWLYVALSGSPKAGPGVDETTLPPADRAADGIGVVDLQKLALVRTIESGQDPEAFDLAAGDVLVVSNEETAEASIVDRTAGRVRARVPVGGEPEGVTTAPDGIVWVTSEEDDRVTAIDPAKAAAIATVATGRRPRMIAFSPDGARGFVTGELDASVTILDARTRVQTGRIAIERPGGTPRPMGIAIDRAGEHAYVSNGRDRSVAVIALASDQVTGIIPDVGTRPWGIAIAPDGRVYTANGPSDDVSVIDPASGRVVARITTGGSPWGVVIAP